MRWTLPKSAAARWQVTLVWMIALGVWAAVGSVVEAALPAGMKLVSENEHLELYIDESTAEIAVRVRASGDIWYSNPPGNQRAKGQAVIRYFAPGAVEGMVNTHADAVAHGQFEIVSIDSGVRVKYTLGQQYGEFAIIPPVLTEARVHELAERAEDESVQRTFLQAIERYYTPVILRRTDEPLTLPASLRVFQGITLESPAKQLSNNEVQRLLRNILGRMVGERRDVETANDVTPDMFDPFIDRVSYVLNDNIPSFLLRQVLAAFENIGYTMDDKVEDNLLSNFDPPDVRLEIFGLAIEYRLEGPDLVVRIPYEDIEYPKDVIDRGGKYGPRNQVISLPIHSIRVLEYFGAADQQQEGYMLVPDGSGALIYLNNGKAGVGTYVGTVYGHDWAQSAPRERMTRTRQIHLPVFGMKQGEKAFLAIIEESAASARINAAVSSGPDSFNRIWPTFVVRPQTTLDLVSQWQFSLRVGYVSGLSQLGVFQYRPNQSDIQLRYRFLSGEDADFAGMARAYREYLIQLGRLPESLADAGKGAPMFVELVGSVKKNQPLLGFPRMVDLQLTTYSQALEIGKALEEAGVDKVVFRYVGWSEGGIRHPYPARVKLLKALGSKREFDAFREFVEAKGWGLFPDVSLAYVYEDRWFDGFSRNRHVSRTIDRKVARRYSYDMALFGMNQNDFMYVLSPSVLPDLVGRFLSAYRSLGLSGLSLRHLGTALNSDLREDEEKLVDRTQAQRLVEGELARLAREFDLLVTGANDYALAHAVYVLEVPYSSSGHDLFDRDIPFFQMVIHGSLDYAGAPVNSDFDPVDMMLKTVELGGSLYYQWSYAPSESVKDTDYDRFLSLHYGVWFESATEMYRRLNDELLPVRGRRMIGHEEVRPNVYRTDYDGGYSVVVNYNHDEVIVDGYRVGGRDFAVIFRAS